MSLRSCKAPLLLLVVAGAALGLAPAANANHERNGTAALGASESSEHFVIHFDPAATPTGAPTMAGYARARLPDLEQAYARLVTDGGGTPNAGLRAPSPDADGKTDVYLARPPGASASFSGGRVIRDSHGASSYVFMTPDLDPVSFRFVGAHEFMHVLQNAYVFQRGDILFEGFANWAAEFATGLDPLDHNFANFGSPTSPAPWTPLDCFAGTWEGHFCDNYWQWLFIQRQVEDYGPAFVTGFYDAFAASSGFGDTMTLIDTEIRELSGGSEGLRTRFASYARDVWDPTRWETSALATIHEGYGPPNATRVYRSTADTGSQSHSVDHLATRYVEVVNDGGFAPTGPDDQVRISLTRPSGLASNSDLLERVAGTAGLVDIPGPGGSGPMSITRPFDPAVTKELIVPLTNDTTATNDLAFGYRVEFLPGAPAPPANDTQAGAVRARLGRVAATDNVYAGGRGSEELPGSECDSSIGDATRGVWYRFTAPTANRYGFSAKGSNFPAVISLHRTEDGGFRGCSLSGELNIDLGEGQSVDVYVGRRAGFTATGSDARLAVSGPPGPAPETTITSGTADGSTSDRARHSFEFTATGSFPEFECRLDASEWSLCESPRVFTRLDVGQHTFEVRGVAAGATDPTPASRSFTITRPPNDDLVDAVPIARAGATVTGHNETATAEAGEPAHGGNEAGASVWYRWVAQGDGEATIETCRDSVGLDTTLGVYRGSSVGELSEVAGNDDACGQNGFQSRVVVAVEAGEVYWIAVDGYLADGFGKGFGRPRFGRARGEFDLTIDGPPDTVAPVASIDSGPSGTVRSRTASFSLSANEDTAELQCRLNQTADPTAFSPCEKAYSATDLADGQHTLAVYAVDGAGNVGPAVTRTWEIDATAPTASIVAGPSGSTESREANFGYTSDDANASFSCSLDGAAFAPCPASGTSYGALGDGAHTFAVRAIDPVGNVGLPDTRSWTIAQPSTDGGNAGGGPDGGGSGSGGDGDGSGGSGSTPPPGTDPGTSPSSDAACKRAKAKLAKALLTRKRAETKRAKAQAKTKLRKARKRVKSACG